MELIPFTPAEIEEQRMEAIRRRIDHELPKMIQVEVTNRIHFHPER